MIKSIILTGTLLVAGGLLIYSYSKEAPINETPPNGNGEGGETPPNGNGEGGEGGGGGEEGYSVETKVKIL